MFYQTDKDLQFEADSDCYLFDVLRILEKTGGFEYTRDQVMQIRKLSVRAEFIDKDGFLNEKGISGLATVSSGLTSHHVYAKRVGSNDNYNNIIALFSRKLSNNKRMYHFVLMDSFTPDIVEWDPWSKVGAKTTREGNIISYRYIFSEVV